MGRKQKGRKKVTIFVCVIATSPKTRVCRPIVQVIKVDFEFLPSSVLPLSNILKL